jgi:hypothetical protein
MLAERAVYREGHAMGSTAAFYVIVAMLIGGLVGWYARQAKGIHSDIQTYKTRLPVFRKARNRSGLISAAIVVLTLLVLHALVS